MTWHAVRVSDCVTLFDIKRSQSPEVRKESKEKESGFVGCFVG